MELSGFRNGVGSCTNKSKASISETLSTGAPRAVVSLTRYLFTPSSMHKVYLLAEVVRLISHRSECGWGVACGTIPNWWAVHGSEVELQNLFVSSKCIYYRSLVFESMLRSTARCWALCTCVESGGRASTYRLDGVRFKCNASGNWLG